MQFLINKISGTIWLYFSFTLLLAILLVWTSVRALRENPSREVGLEVPNLGWVTLRLRTDPFPPITNDNVTVNLASSNSRGLSVDLGPKIPFTFGSQGSSSALGSGSATSTTDGGYQAGINFPEPGSYWLAFDVGSSKPAQFNLNVQPAQQ
jgi:hypothetical protein